MAAAASSLLRLCVCAALLLLASATGSGRFKSMTPAQLVAATRSSRSRQGALDPLFDCAWRTYALEYAAQVQPWISAAQLHAVFDSLEIVALKCNASEALHVLRNHVPAPRASAAAARPALSIFVDYVGGSDGSGDGSQGRPLKTLAAAVALSRAQRGAAGGGVIAVVLRAGTHVVSATISLTPGDSLLSFQAFPGEAPVVSGALPLPKLAWLPFNVSNGTASHWGPVRNDTNAVSGECTPGNDNVPDKGVMPDWQSCQASCKADRTCTAWTYHTPACGESCTGWIQHCCWRLDGAFPAVSQTGVLAQDYIGASPKNVWVADLAALPMGAPTTLTALHVNGHRATLARFPNANPEVDIFPKGYLPSALSWLPPLPGPVSNETFTVDLAPLGLADAGRGVYINYTVGIGGNADRYTPPRAFWASRDFGPRSPEQPTATCNRWQEMHLRSPSGIDVGGDLPNAPYKNTEQMVVRTWRDGHWYSWMMGAKPSSSGVASQFDFVSGCHQGGEGCDEAAEYFVQGLLEELDAENEYFHDGGAGKLYFFPNATNGDSNVDGSPNVTLAEVPSLAVIFNVYGSEEFPAHNISFLGLTFTGGRPTFMDPRGQPSGGDWALERLGVLLLEGTEDVLVADCLFTRIDGNSVFLSGYNRRAAVLRNEFSLLGQNAVASWGRSVDYDGTDGQQPRHSLIAGNIAHDLGLEQKQSSFYFQAQTCEATLAANIVYNIPRAAINFEDGFGGANVITDCLLYSTCRESSDHGAFNSWDRLPFVTLVRDGITPSSIPAFNLVHHNFIVANFAADGGCLDNDDGSAWYKIEQNFCVFGGHKSDFDGHSKWSVDNLHIYASVYGDRCLEIGAQYLPQPGFAEVYANNTCVLVPGAECLDLGQSAAGFPAPPAFYERIKFYNNTIYATAGSACKAAGGPFSTMAEFQAGGFESGPPSTIIATLPSAETIIGWARAKLGDSASRIREAVARA